MKRFVVALLPIIALAPALGQSQNAPEIDTLNFEANIGSFKMATCKGKAEFTFQGTALLADFKGTVTPVGDLKVEFDDKKKNRKTYFGKGKLILEGEWSAVQVFGKGFKGYFRGHGFVQMQGEFDKDLKTGTWWWSSSPDKKTAWFTSLMTVQCPPNAALNARPKLRGGG